MHERSGILWCGNFCFVVAFLSKALQAFMAVAMLYAEQISTELSAKSPLHSNPIIPQVQLTPGTVQVSDMRCKCSGDR